MLVTLCILVLILGIAGVSLICWLAELPERWMD